jgi:hypothetical protein
VPGEQESQSGIRRRLRFHAGHDGVPKKMRSTFWVPRLLDPGSREAASGSLAWSG